LDRAILQMALAALVVADLAHLGNTTNILVYVVNSLLGLSSVESYALEVSLKILLIWRWNIHLKVLVRLASIRVLMELLAILSKVGSLGRGRVSVEVGSCSALFEFLLCLVFFVVGWAFGVISDILFLIPRTIHNAIRNTRRWRSIYFKSLLTCLRIVGRW